MSSKIYEPNGCDDDLDLLIILLQLCASISCEKWVQREKVEERTHVKRR